MNGASLERLKGLWEHLNRLQPEAPEYKALEKQIRAESDAYNALVEAQESPHRKLTDSNRKS